ncbi:MAG: Gfo/Idh/MocA family oxidoreductase [Bacillota bacterium]
MKQVRALNVGVLGLGFIGELHSRIWSEVPNGNLVAVADVNADRATEIAQRYNCKCYTDYAQMLQDQNVQAIDICVPEEYHVDTAIAAAKARKHILIEKPIANTHKEATAIMKAAMESGVRLMVAHVLRFDPRYVQLHDSIARGDLGEAVHVRIRRNNPWNSAARLNGRISIVRYLGVHDIDIMRWYVGSEVDKVYAQKVSKVNKERGCEDTVYAVLTFANGAIGCLELSWALPITLPTGIYATAEFVGTKGAGYVEIFGQGLSIYTEHTAVFPDTLHWPEVNGRITGDLRDELEHFADAIMNDKEFIVPTEDAVEAVRIIDAIFASIEKGQPVMLR